MKYISYIVLTFIAINIFGILFATGESFPVPERKTFSVDLPTSVR